MIGIKKAYNAVCGVFLVYNSIRYPICDKKSLESEGQIVHIFKQSIFLRNYLQFLNKFFDTEPHIIIVYGKSRTWPTFENTTNIKIIKINSITELEKLLHAGKALQKAKLIICHALIVQPLVVFLLMPNIIRKTIWVIWGGDIKDYAYHKKQYHKTLLVYCYYRLKKIVTSRFPYVIARPSEYEHLIQYYNVTAERIDIPILYSSGDTFDYSSIPKKHNGINVLIGHSAFPDENHSMWLDRLIPLKNDVHIYLITSYGDNDYAKKIQTYGKEIYGTNISFITEMLPMNQYLEFLKTIDVGILDAPGQSGLGAIHSLLKVGAKVYLNDQSLNLKVITEKGYVAFKASSAVNCSKEELIHMDEKDRLKNKTLHDESKALSDCVVAWQGVFRIANE